MFLGQFLVEKKKKKKNIFISPWVLIFFPRNFSISRRKRRQLCRDRVFLTSKLIGLRQRLDDGDNSVTDLIQDVECRLKVDFQPRSQGLSSLPPLVVGRKTLVAAGHMTTQNLGGKKICRVGGAAEYFVWLM